MEFADVIVMSAYGTLVIELTAFPIPSEASTLDLLTRNRDDVESSDSLSLARNRTLVDKTFRFLLPTTIGVALFLLPLLATW